MESPVCCVLCKHLRRMSCRSWNLEAGWSSIFSYLDAGVRSAPSSLLHVSCAATWAPYYLETFDLRAHNGIAVHVHSRGSGQATAPLGSRVSFAAAEGVFKSCFKCVCVMPCYVNTVAVSGSLTL